MELINKYKQLKLREIKLCEDILHVMNYKTFRALESDDFIVDDFIIPTYIVNILNYIYKHPNRNSCSEPDYRVFYCNKVKKIIKKFKEISLNQLI